MSGRKTEEIKLRLTAEEKASWQVVAELEQTTVSELIRREMNARARMGPSSAGVAGWPFPTEADIDLRGSDGFSPREPAESTSSNPLGPAPPAPFDSLLDSEDLEILRIDASPQEDEGASDEVGAKEGLPGTPLHTLDTATVTLNGEEVTPTRVRRTLPCACGKQPYVFCQPCDG